MKVGCIALVGNDRTRQGAPEVGQAVVDCIPTAVFFFPSGYTVVLGF